MSRNRHKKSQAVLDNEQRDIDREAVVKQARQLNSERIRYVKSNGEGNTILSTRAIRPEKIFIAVPTDELMFSKFLQTYANLNIMPWDSVSQTENTYLPEARNSMWNVFRTEEAAGNWMLMLDSDVLVPPDLIEKLLAHKKPIVGGWYKKKEKFRYKDVGGVTHQIQRPVVYDFSDQYDELGRGLYRERVHPGKGLEQVGGMGAGCWLVHRSVAEAVGPSPFGNDVGEDLFFCDKVREAGIEMWVDWDIPCAHAGVFYV